MFIDQYADRDCRSVNAQDPFIFRNLFMAYFVYRSILRLNDKKVNERLDDEQQRRADIAERQDTTLAEVGDLTKENERLLAVSNRTSKRIFEVLQLGWFRGLGSELKFLMQKTYE